MRCCPNAIGMYLCESYQNQLEDCMCTPFSKQYFESWEKLKWWHFLDICTVESSGEVVNSSQAVLQRLDTNKHAE